MPYEKQGFVDGDALFANQLNHIEQGVYDTSVAVENSQTHLPVIGNNGNWFLWDGNQYVDSGKPSRGESGEPGADGQQGPQGEPGYTPVKGVDYYTEADKQEIVGAVLAALPDGDEVNY